MSSAPFVLEEQPTAWTICIHVSSRHELELLEQTLQSPGLVSTAAPILVALPHDVQEQQAYPLLERGGRCTFFRYEASAQAINPIPLWREILTQADKAHDLIFLRPGARVPVGFDMRLARAIRAQPGIAAAFPLIGDGPFAFALFPDAPPRIWSNLEQVDMLLQEYAQGVPFEVPLALDTCGYYRREALSSLPEGMGFAGLVTHWRRHGLSCIGVDHVFVQDAGAEDQRQSWPQDTLPVELKQLRHGHPLSGLRHAMRQLMERNEPVAANIHPALNPVRLHVAHSWGGGLGRWVDDFTAADTNHHSLILRSIGNWGAFGEKIVLFRADNPHVPLREHVLSIPIRSTAVASSDYARFLREIVHDFQVKDILVSSLIGHSLDVLRTGLPTIVIGHDFYPFCAAINVVFDKPCDRCDRDRLGECFAGNPNNRLFKGIDADEWMSMREAWVEAIRARHVRYVVPTQFVADTMRRLEPRMPDEIPVIPHGIDLPPPGSPPLEPRPAERLRIVVLGRMTREKGLDLLLAILPRIRSFADLYLLGCGEDCSPFEGEAGVTCIQHYNHAELGRLLGEISPDLGLLLSTVPETFSYTLSELWHYHVPPVATDMGSFAERIERGRTGLLVPLDAEAIANELMRLDQRRDELASIRSHLRRHAQPSRQHMIRSYEGILPASASPIRLVARALLALPVADSMAGQPFYVDHQVPFRRVLAAFLAYAEDKFRHTQRLPGWGRGIIASVLRLMRRKAAEGA